MQSAIWPQPARAVTAPSRAGGSQNGDDRPRLIGDGPTECSSSVELARLPYIVHDVNRYYAELGVPFWATRRELREAYQAKDGQSSARLTYIVKQLLNPEIRSVYDNMPFGMTFVDRYVQEAIKQQMLDKKSDRLRSLHDIGVDIDAIDEEAIERDIYSEMGVPVEDEEGADTPPETVDANPFKAQDVTRPAEHFPYAYYLYKVRFPGREEVSRLEEWQRFLVTALAREGIRIHFAVGLHGDPHRWLFAKVGYRMVFFLSTQHMPTAELAASAAQQVREQLHPASRPLATTER